ncbi:hypothetical protein HYH03_012736 [Edaphochlamys debaryana]|uniref:Uncharacterized protein n=1 Tax=Edaphochlamys debaryana TaxID=47281 RepID=A0A835XSA6_9CHLO|nr:hypothetical protein HYH03_012736 [Edaphochlamys debaryana]|eukprot:KAG2488737.1 hypothetical protein HYH03_012736 [Edaphochlamys debaryana]
MILYENHYWGIPLLLHLYGSAFPRALLFASLAALETALLYQYAPTYITQSLKNPTIFQIFGFVVGFALVFRSSLSYNRFWEARTMLQTITGRLTYFVIETVAADLGSMNHDTATPEEMRAAHRFVTELCHLVSMLFALQLKNLRKDFDLSTVYKHKMSGPPPYLDAGAAMRGWRRLEVLGGRMFALNDIFNIHNPQQEAAMPVIGGLSEAEVARLSNLVPSLEMKGKGGMLNATRPFAIFAMINQLYIRRIADGGLRTLAPLVSRLGGIAEEAMAAYGHCTKLATTQFPFPWAQVVLAFLAIMALTLPFVVTCFVDQLWMGVCMTFIVVLTYWSLNEVATEMEDPFGFDPNDLPLARYAFDFNNGILCAVQQLRPPYFDALDAEAEALAGQGKPAPVAEGSSRHHPGPQRSPSAAPLLGDALPSAASLEAHGPGAPAFGTCSSKGPTRWSPSEPGQQRATILVTAASPSPSGSGLGAGAGEEGGPRSPRGAEISAAPPSRAASGLPSRRGSLTAGAAAGDGPSPPRGAARRSAVLPVNT